ncbi:MAG: ABC transporter permease, partial [Chitinivibrionales bacterium]
MLLIIKKELKCFLASERGVFFVYLFILLVWSLVTAFNLNKAETSYAGLWLVFFSVVIGGNFSNTVFIAERLNNSLEILITSGLSRTSIVMGKILYVSLMTWAMGGACFLLASFESRLFPESFNFPGPWQYLDYILLYMISGFMNASSSAWLSVKIDNPRFIHFINLFILSIVVSVYVILSKFFPSASYMLHAVIALWGVACS